MRFIFAVGSPVIGLVKKVTGLHRREEIIAMHVRPPAEVLLKNCELGANRLATRRADVGQRKNRIVARPVSQKVEAMTRIKSKATRSKLLLAVSAVAATAFTAPVYAQVQLKPGDVVFGTNAENPAGAGRLFVYDPTTGAVTQIGGSFFNGVGGLAMDNQGNLIVGTQASSTSGAGRLYRVSFDAQTSASTTTQIGSTTFANGIGGLDVNLADNTIYLGTNSRNTSGASKVYSVNGSSGVATQIGTNTFSNSVGDLAFDAANNRILMGTSSRSATGKGGLLSLDLNTSRYTTVGNSSMQYTNGVEAISLYYRQAVDGTITQDSIYGTWANNSTGSGRLYRLDEFSNPSDPSSWTGSQINPAVTYLNGVTGADFDFDRNIWLGTSSNTTSGSGALWQVDPITGVRARITPTNNPTGNVFNGISSVFVVQPQADFVGGNNITIDGNTTTSSVFLQVDPVTGSRGFFSGNSSQTLNVGDLVGSMDQRVTTVRTGIGGPNNEAGNLTLDIAVDYNGLIPTNLLGNPVRPNLTLRAANDVTITSNGIISDSDTVTSLEGLDLSLIAGSPRAYGTNIGTTGAVIIQAPIDLHDGNFFSAGKAFDNSAAGVSLTTTGNATFQHTGNVTVSNPFYVGGNVAILAGDFISTATGTFSSDVGVTSPVNTFNVTALAGTGATGSVTIGGTIVANTFTSTGVAFTNNLPIVASNGALEIHHTGAVILNDSLTTVAGNITIEGDSIVNPGVNTFGAITAAGDVLLRGVSTISIEHQLTANNLTVNHLTGGTGLAFTNIAAIDVTNGTLDITNAGGATNFNDNVTATTFNSFGGTLATVGGQTLSVSGAATLNQSGSVNFDGTTNVGSLTSSSTSFTTGSASVLTSNADVVLTTTDATDFNSDVVINGSGSLVGNGGTSFDSTGVSLQIAGRFEVNQSTDFTLNTVTTGTSFSAITTGGSFTSNAITANGVTSTNAILISAPTAITLDGPVLGNGPADLTASSGATTFNNSFGLNGNTLTVNANGLAVTSSGTIGVGANAADAVGATSFTIGTSTQVDGEVNVGPLTVSTNTFTSTAPVSSAGDATFTLSGGAVDIASTLTTSAGGNLNVSGASTFDTLNGTQGTLNIAGYASINASSDITLHSSTTGARFEAITSTSFTANDITSNGATSGQSIHIDAPTGITLNGPTNGNGDALLTSVSGTTTINNSFDLTGNAFTLAANDFTVTSNGSVGTGTGVGSTNLTITNATTVDGVVNVGPLTVSTQSITSSATITSAGNFGLTMTPTGPADFNADVTTTAGGDFDATGLTTFDTLNGTAVAMNIAGHVSLDGSGDFTLNDTTTGTSFLANTTGGSFTSNAITANGETAGSSISITAPTFITLNGAVLGTGAATLTSLSGTTTVNNTFALSGGSLSVNAAAFTTTGTGIVSAIDHTQLNITGPVDIGANFSTATFDSQGTGSSGATFVTQAGTLLASNGLTTINHAGDVTFNGQVTTGAFDITAPNLTSNAGATVISSGNVVLTVDGATDFNDNVTTTAGANFTSNTTGNTFDSTGVILDISGGTNIQRADSITAGSLNSDTTLDLRVNGAGGISITGDSLVGGDVTSLNTAAGSFASTGISLRSTGGSVNITNSPAASAGSISTSAVRAGTSMTMNGGGITADGLLQTDNGAITLTSTVDGTDTTVSGGVIATGGNFTSTGNVAAGMDFNSTGGPVVASGSVTLNHTGDVTTDAVTSTGSSIAINTTNSSTLTTGNLSAGSTISALGNNLTVNGTVAAGSNITVTANGGAVDFNGDVTTTGTGNFVSAGTGATTFDSTGVLLTIAGSTQVTHTGDVTTDRIKTGTSFTATTADPSIFTSNTLVAGTTASIAAPGGIYLSGGTIGAFTGALKAGGNVTTTAVNGLTEIDGTVQLTAGSYTNTSVDFNNTGFSPNAAPITLPGNATFNNTGTVTIGSNLSGTGSTSTLSYSQSPNVFIDSGATVSMGSGSNYTGGVVNFSGGSTTQVLNQSRINNTTGFVGNSSNGVVTLDGGDVLVNPTEVQWWNRGSLYVGGSATSNVGNGLLTVGQNACLRVDGTMKVWANDTVIVEGGCIELGALDMDNNRGNFLFYSGELCYQNNLTLQATGSISRAIGVGSGTQLRLTVQQDQTLCVENETNMLSTLFLQGGTFSTGTIRAPKMNLSQSYGTIDLNKQDFVVRRLGDSSTPAGTFGEGTQIIPTGLVVDVNSTPLASNFQTKVRTGALLKFTGGTVNSAKGTVNQGTIQFADSASLLDGGALTNTSAGLIYGTGEVRANLANAGQVRASSDELLRFTGTSNSSSGTLRVINQGTLEFVNGIDISGSLVGDGTLIGPENITVSSAPGVNPPTLAGQGIFLKPGGSVNFSAKADIFADFATIGNHAPTIIASGTSTLTFYKDVYLGAVDLNTFNVTEIRASSVDSKVVFFGLVKGYVNQTGSGEFRLDGGDLDPGFSPGHMSLTNATFEANSTLTMDIGGLNPASSFGNFGAGFYDQANIANWVLNGTESAPVVIDLNLWGSYALSRGDTFTLVEYGSITGNLDAVRFNLPGNESNWLIDWQDHALVLSYVPEPSTLMLAFPAAALGLRRRRRTV